LLLLHTVVSTCRSQKENEGIVWDEDVMKGEEHGDRISVEEIVWPDEILRMLA